MNLSVLKRKIEKKYFFFNNKQYHKILEKIYFYLFLDDIKFTAKYYHKQFGTKLNLKKPESFNEKIQWLKLNYRIPLYTKCADKLAVRNYIKSKIGDPFLIPLIFSTKKIRDITPEKLPDFPFIIKTNHDSGNYFIVRDKKNQDWKKIRRELKKSLIKNYYFYWREWQYKNITPSIIIEKLLQQENGMVPYDYKFHCINGKVEFIQVDLDRETNHTRCLYDSKWNLLPFSYEYSKGKKTNPPNNLEKMICLAHKLSIDFTYVRVDFYENNNQIYFGELTFTPGAGIGKFSPMEWDLKFGQKLKLPNL